MIKIKFPSCEDLSTEDWLEQMELTLFHVKKAYEKFKKNIPEENKNDVSFYLSYPAMEINKEFNELIEKEKISFEDTQEVELVISY